jgi:ribonuclease HI
VTSPSPQEERPADPAAVVIYTDGACSGNPGPGGWAAILRYGPHEKVLQGGASLTTNNRMELRAVIAALQALRRPCRVELFTDSEYVRRGVTEWLGRWRRNGWLTATRQPVKNQDLWRELYAAMHSHKVTWRWVRGHAGNELNERTDQLAVSALNTVGLHGQPDLEGLDVAIPE